MTDTKVLDPQVRLKKHQKYAARWLAARKFAILGDEQRVGKTAPTIVATDIVGANRVLVLCPASGRESWAKSFDEWSRKPRKYYVVLHSTDPLPAPDERAVVFCTYALLTNRRVRRALRDMNPDVLILDEAHNIKNPEANRTSQVLGRKGLIRTSKHVWALSGTINPNNYEELWVWLRVSGRFKKERSTFIKRFCHYYIDERGKYVITGSREEKAQEIRDLLDGIYLRRRFKEVNPSLPPIQWKTHEVNPGEVDWSAYEYEFTFPTVWENVERQSDMVRSTLMAMDGWDDPDKIMSVLQSMQNKIKHWRSALAMYKVQPTVEHIERLLDYHDKVVVFGQHVKALSMLRDALKHHRAFVYYGGLNPRRRQRYLSEFNYDPARRVFIGQYQAAGELLDLSVARHVIFLEPSYVPKDIAQAVMRIRNMNQKEKIFATMILLKDSADKLVVRAMLRKAKALTELYG